MTHHLALALLAATACSSPRSTVPTPVAPGRPPPADVAQPPPATPALAAPPAGLRLPATARPLGYQVAIEIDPAKAEFTGRVVIDVDVGAAAHPLWLNAKDLTIDAATVRAAAGTPAQPLRVVAGPDGVIGLAAEAPIAPGRVAIELTYHGAATVGGSGIERREDRGDWYAFTFLEPQGARRVVPCFDEPGFKVPWRLELTTPAGLFAAANAPVEGDEGLPDGRRRVRFAPTLPIPSYLFAFAVGPFEAIDAGTTRGGVPMRVIVPHGKTADAAFMARQSAPLVAAMEDYTGIPFPYPKLDHIVTPGWPAGAMENVGLITYAPKYLVIPDGESDESRRDALETMAHEVAHQWFGDLVTLAWWDDAWLNEGFAVWAASRLLAEHYPGLGGGFSAPASRRFALAAEADPNARAVRQPVVEPADLERAFDDITYDKGATVLDMFEHALGPEAFRTGVRAYLTAHAGGNATAADFIGALSAASHQDLSAPLATWLDRPGAPVVAMALACPRGGPAAVELTQHRYRVADDTRPPDPTLWHVPVCVRVTGEARPRCATLTGSTGRIELGARCPRLVVPSGRGHYHVALSPRLRADLLAAWPRLAPAEQSAFVGDTVALVDAAEVELEALLDLLPKVGASTDPIAARAALAALWALDPVVAPADRPAFEKLVRRAFGGLARRTGWTTRPREPIVSAAARSWLMPVVAVGGRDPAVGRQTVALARRWMDDRTVVPESMWGPLLRAAVVLDDGPLFERLLARVANEPDTATQRAIASALGATRDPARLERVLAHVAAQPTFDVDTLSAFFGPDLAALSAVRIAFWRDHAAELLPKIPEESRRYMAPSSCYPEHRDGIAALLEAHFVPLPDYGASSRDRALVSMAACAQKRARKAKLIAAYLAAHR